VYSPFVTRWYGRVNAWGLQSAPKPGGAESASLAGVSCPVAPVCVAAGYSRTPADDLTALTERRIGANWSVLPQPQSSPSSRELDAVSCPTLALCRAVGVEEAWRFDGASWQVESIPNPPGDVLVLRGISCPTRSFCMAVGFYGVVPGHYTGTAAAKWTP
jgi:hypothetical protein